MCVRVARLSTPSVNTLGECHNTLLSHREDRFTNSAVTKVEVLIGDFRDDGTGDEVETRALCLFK